jgi:hypothetical protein
MTPSGIEPATFRFVAQYLNNCATAVPPVFAFHAAQFVALHSIQVQKGLDWCHSYPRCAVEGIVQFQTPAAYFWEKKTIRINLIGGWWVLERTGRIEEKEIPFVHTGNLTMKLRS